MRRLVRAGLLVVGISLGLAATMVLLSTLMVAAAGGTVDLQVRTMAPEQVNAGASYVANVSCANKGGLAAPDNWLRVTLPEGTQFVQATYTGGDPHPPDEINGRVLTWNLNPMVADSTWQHVLVKVGTDAGLVDGTSLTVVAEVGGSAAESDTDNNVATVISTVKGTVGSPYLIYLPIVLVQ